MYSCTPAEAMCTIAWHTTTHDYSASAFSVANLALLLFRSVHVNVGFENPHTGLSQIRSGSVCLFMVGCSWQGLERDYERIAMWACYATGLDQGSRRARPSPTPPPPRAPRSICSIGSRSSGLVCHLLKRDESSNDPFG